MAFKVIVQDTAEAEVKEIFNNLMSYSAKAGKKFYTDLGNCAQNLSDGIIDYGLSRFDALAEKGYHSVLFSNYVLLYFEEGDTRTIAHVFHQKQNYASFV